ncbi:rhodanese-like domain-containing protein [bacterium]|jgi:rhodanese-related sulfurtransferase|nr:rhodanese-like domain-containing protein [bacterium]
MREVTVNELSELIKIGDELNVIDVRTPAEFKGVHIDGVSNSPMETIESEVDVLKLKKNVYVICNSGNRSQMAIKDLEGLGVNQLINVKGGMQAWNRAKLPVIRTKKWVMPIIQQVMAIAGSLVIVGQLGAHFVHPGYGWLSAGVGSGLLFAGVSGNCYMAKMLAMMPWNK